MGWFSRIVVGGRGLVGFARLLDPKPQRRLVAGRVVGGRRRLLGGR